MALYWKCHGSKYSKTISTCLNCGSLCWFSTLLPLRKQLALYPEIPAVLSIGSISPCPLFPPTSSFFLFLLNLLLLLVFALSFTIYSLPLSDTLPSFFFPLLPLLSSGSGWFLILTSTNDSYIYSLFNAFYVLDIVLSFLLYEELELIVLEILLWSECLCPPSPI